MLFCHYGENAPKAMSVLPQPSLNARVFSIRIGEEMLFIVSRVWKRSLPNARCLHDDGLYAACLQPSRHAVQVGREASECWHCLGISPFGHRNIMFGIANINSIRVSIQSSEPFLPPLLVLFFVFAGFAILNPHPFRSYTRPGPVAIGLKMSPTGRAH
jgi:hypothetical protein